MQATPHQGYWSSDNTHRLPVRVYYEDTDFTGVVYYANYLKFFERGRTDALRCLGVHHAALLEAETPLGFAVRKITVEYERPARIDDALLVATQFKAAKGARFEILQQIHKGEQLIAKAGVEAVCIDLSGRPKRLPVDLVERLGDFSVDDLKA
ncbi:tol-pal system-associated acyl-CoA thioesterase [Woodsholea maritima]|uniref:tol-pal system-associated acyl-CoA thioesterase n=1 Tax=Woodsholea maritima TaxID=240237 RepID=UPI00036D12E8|nr:tol-pal system-associated acyl-CoA thioesterase [Woodsholea maritima]